MSTCVVVCLCQLTATITFSTIHTGRYADELQIELCFDYKFNQSTQKAIVYLIIKIFFETCWKPKATSFPVSRAAALIFNIMKFKKLVDREELPPLLLRNTIPICMAQYERIFSTTR